jgi:outer membrane protein assembly factor BamB
MARTTAGSGRDHFTLCVRLDGPAGERTRPVDWKARSGGTFVPSPVCLGEHYYYVEDTGWGNCLLAATGERVWRERLAGKFSASLLAGDGKVYFTSELGVVTVVKAGPKFEVLARNDVGESLVATPAAAGGGLYLRGDKHLYCIGDK